MKKLNYSKEKALELFSFICEQERRGFKVACRSLRDDIAYTAGIIGNTGFVVEERNDWQSKTIKSIFVGYFSGLLLGIA